MRTYGRDGEPIEELEFRACELILGPMKVLNMRTCDGLEVPTQDLRGGLFMEQTYI